MRRRNSQFSSKLLGKHVAADFDGDSVSGETMVLVKYDNGDIKLMKIKDVE